MKKVNYLSTIFETISETIAGAEKSFLDLLSAIVPWAVPVIPAYLTYFHTCLLYTSPSPRDRTRSRMPSSA